MESTMHHERAKALDEVAAAFAAAPGTQRVLLATLEACREPRTATELDEIMGAVLSTNRSVFGPVELRALLERHGALAYQKSAEELAVEEAERQRATALERGEEVPDPAVDEDGNLVVAHPAPGHWVLTEAGRAYVDSDPVATYALELLQREGYYLPVYQELLAFVAEEPRTKPQIDQVIDGHPLLQEPRMFAGHFVGELEKAGALEWNDVWTLTAVGQALLDDLNGMNARGATEEA